MHVFTYGSLMFDRVWAAVAKGHYRKLPARIQGYRRVRIRGEVYPALVPAAAESSVDGVIYLDVDATDRKRLDRFEGIYYEKVREAFETVDGKLIAQLYVFKESYADLLEDVPWDPQWFKTEGIQTFMSAYGGYRWLAEATVDESP